MIMRLHIDYYTAHKICRRLSFLFRLCILTACFHVFLQGIPLTAEPQKPDLTPLLIQAQTDFLRPAYEDLAIKSKALKKAMRQFCTQPSKIGLKESQTHFKAALLTWSYIEPVRFGPMARRDRHARLQYWPDRKGRGRKQLRQFLTQPAAQNLTLAQLQNKSVALQGFPALENLLFTQQGALLTKGEPKHCHLAHIISQNIAEITHNLSAEWQKGQKFPRQFSSPSTQNPHYKNSQEAALELYKSLAGGLQLVIDLKLKKALRSKAETSRPKYLPYWRSTMALSALKANIAGLKDLFIKSGFSALIEQGNPGMGTTLLREYDYALKWFDKIKLPVTKAVHDKSAREKFKLALLPLENIVATGNPEISAAASLSLGFNELDGD